MDDAIYYKKDFMIKKIVLLSVALYSYLSFALNPQITNDKVEQLVQWETTSNGASLRSPQKVNIYHYEIPLNETTQKLLTSDISKNTPPEIINSLIFTKKGTQYLRWIINPEDTKWAPQVEEWLRKNNLDTQKHLYFTGQQTSSRSYIISDPKSKSYFSIKVSTDHAGGLWNDKNLPISDAVDARNLSTIIESVADRMQFNYFVPLIEPFMYGIKDLDQAMVVRLLNDVAKGTKYYLPVFSALHETTGKEIALLNGSNDPVAYWKEHLVIPLAKAYAEYMAFFGMSYDSPHGQNFLIELDEHKKPTGKIIFKDFSDSYLVKDFYQGSYREKLLKVFYHDNIKDDLHVSIGLLHGNNPPSWINNYQYKELNETFFKTYEKELSTILHLKTTISSVYTWKENFSYYSKKYEHNANLKTHFTDWADCLSGAFISKKTGKICPPYILARNKKRDFFYNSSAMWEHLPTTDDNGSQKPLSYDFPQPKINGCALLMDTTALEGISTAEAFLFEFQKK